jgi:hypothetical protein
LREHTTPEWRGHLVRLALVVFGFAAVNGRHREGMPQHEGHPFVHTAIGEPIPSEETLDGDDQPRTRGGHGLENVFRRRFHSAVQQDFPSLTQDADVHAPGMQVNTAVKLVLVGGEAREVSSSLVSGSFPDASIPLGYAEGEASIIINPLELTAHSAGSCGIPGVFPCGPQLTGSVKPPAAA